MVEAIESGLERNTATELRLVNRQIAKLQKQLRELTAHRSSLLVNLEHRFCRQPLPQPEEVDGFDRLLNDTE